MAGNLSQPRILKSSQNTQLSYELPHRIHTATAYPIPSPNGSTIILYGHENGVKIVWRGGRPFKRPSAPAAPKRANGAGSAVISLDSDDEDESAKQYEDKPEFEDEEEELDPSRPYPSILQTLDLCFGTDVLHLAVLPDSILRADTSSSRGLDLLKQRIVFTAACADHSLRLVTVPLIPPSPASKGRPELRTDFATANAGRGTWGETIILLNGHQKSSDGVSMTLDIAGPPHVIVASHSREVTGRLLLFRISLASQEAQYDPFQSSYLASPATSISFNPALRQHNSHLLVAESTGVCRIYDYKLLTKAAEEVESSGLEQGTWLLSLYAGFPKTKSESRTNVGTHAGFGRKTIVDAQWVASGRAIIVLLNDGEWAIWDIQGVGPGSPQGLLGRHGIKGGSSSEYSLTGFIDGTTKSGHSGPPQIAASKFAPMTPGTRKSIEPFSGKGLNGPARGQISVVEVPSLSPTNPTEEAVLFWLGETFAMIPSLAKYWGAYARKGNGSGDVFNGPTGARIIKLDNVDLQGERCSGIAQISKAAPATGLPSDVLILGEHRLIILSAGKQGRTQPIELTGTRMALVEKHTNNGDLDVMDIEQALTRMENGNGAKRKIFQR